MRFSLSGKLNTALVITFLVITCIGAAVTIPLHEVRMRSNTDMAVGLLDLLVARDSNRLANELFENRIRSMQLHLEEMAAQKDILSITVVDTSGTPVADYSRLTKPESDTFSPVPSAGSSGHKVTRGKDGIPILHYEAPINVLENSAGTIRIAYSLARAHKENLISLYSHLGVLAAALFLALILLNLFLRSFVIRPVKKLIQGMEHLPGQEPQMPIPKLSNDEIGDLTLAFNRMSDELAQAINILKQEIRDRRQAEVRLETSQAVLTESEALFKSVFQILPDPVSITRLSDYTFVDVNQGFVMASGYSRQELIGRTTDALGTWESPDQREHFRKDLRENGRVDNLEVLFRMKEGAVRTSLISAVIINLENEPHILTVIRNIDDRKRMEQALKDSETRFRLAFDNAVEGRGISLPDGTFVQVNTSFADMVGLTPEELLLKTYRDIIHPDYLQEVERVIQDLIDNRLPSVQMETRLINKTGELLWARINCVLVRDDQTSPLYFIADIEDITHGRANEEQLRKYERIVETSPDLISLVDRNYVFESVNTSHLRTHSLTRDRVIGHTISQVIGEALFNEVIKPRLDRVFKGEFIRYQHEFQYGDQGKRYMDVSYYPFSDETGAIQGVVTHQKDITETRRMEQRLIQSQKMEAIGTLAGGIAHDFNNILSGIFGYSQLTLIHIDNPTKAKAHLDQVIKAAQRAAELVQQILTFSRQDDQKKRPLGLYLVIKESLKLLRPSLPSTIDIREKIKSRKPILADPTRMHQVIMNLCTNAYHAMEESGGILTVELNDRIFTENDITPDLLLKPGPHVQLTVSDTGHGMDKETLAKVFDPYFTTKEVGRGTGLGLALVLGVIQEHGGQIKAFSEPGKGSRFDVYLPAIESREIRESSNKEQPSPITGQETIMVVDDEEPIRTLTKDILEEMGYSIRLFTNGLDALDAFRGNPDAVDLVITDMTMPKMTGDILATEMIKIRPDIPIFISSGYSEKMNTLKAAELGIRHFIQKPVDMRLLATLIRKELDSGRREGITS